MGDDDSEPSPPAPAGRPGETPYEDVDVSDLPDWWREAIEEFREHDLRPFQPPRFSDGALTVRTVDRLEDDLGVVIDFVGIRAEYGDDWAVRIDGDVVGTVGRRRTAEAYTEFDVERDEFEAWIREQVRGDDGDDGEPDRE